MIDLSVADYDRFQAHGLSRLPMNAIWAFNTVHFTLSGYSTTVTSERELFRFIDCMSAPLESVFSAFLPNGITEQEFEMIKPLAGKVLGYMNARFPKRSYPGGTLIRTANVHRHINYLFGDEKPAVLEIGAGGGFLGALLINEGYPYAGMDVTQGFYLQQNHLWNHISDGKLVELAGSENIPISPTSHQPVHIPWWLFASLRENTAPKFDVITCNHVLCEMHNWSMRFLVSLGRYILSGSDRPRFFVFENWGSTVVSGKKVDAEEAFNKFGYTKIIDDRHITVFASPDNAHFNPSEYEEKIVEGRRQTEAESRIKKEDVQEYYHQLTGLPGDFSEDHQFLDFIGGDENAFPPIFDPEKQAHIDSIPDLMQNLGGLAQFTMQLRDEVATLRQTIGQGPLQK